MRDRADPCAPSGTIPFASSIASEYALRTPPSLTNTSQLTSARVCININAFNLCIYTRLQTVSGTTNENTRYICEEPKYRKRANDGTIKIQNIGVWGCPTRPLRQRVQGYNHRDSREAGTERLPAEQRLQVLGLNQCDLCPVLHDKYIQFSLA